VKQLRASSGHGRISRFINIYNGIPFDAHLARSPIRILSAKLSSRNGDFFILTAEKAQLLPQTYGLYLYIDVLFLGPLKNMLIDEILLVLQYNTFLQ